MMRLFMAPLDESQPTVYTFVPRGRRVFAGVAQLVEHLTCNQEVAGSSPTASSHRGIDSFQSRTDARAAKGSRL